MSNPNPDPGFHSKELAQSLQEMLGEELLAAFSQRCGTDTVTDPYLIQWLGVYAIVRTFFPDPELRNALSEDFFKHWLPLFIYVGEKCPDHESRRQSVIKHLYHSVNKGSELYRVELFLNTFTFKQEKDKKDDNP